MPYGMCVYDIHTHTHTHTTHRYNNWHSTVAEAWMSVSLLTDDLPRFVKAVKLYNETIHSYLKWGKGEWAAGGRVPGECSETLRDIYHSEFGLGGLLQVCELRLCLCAV